MLFSVEQAFVGREEIRAPLKTPAWEAKKNSADTKSSMYTLSTAVYTCNVIANITDQTMHQMGT